MMIEVDFLKAIFEGQKLLLFSNSKHWNSLIFHLGREELPSATIPAISCFESVLVYSTLKLTETTVDFNTKEKEPFQQSFVSNLGRVTSLQYVENHGYYSRL